MSFDSGGIAVPMQGETVCGDAFALRMDGSALLAVLADGLGHGPLAADCADRAIGAFRNSNETSPG